MEREYEIETIGGRQFRTKGDCARARRDKELIDRLRSENDLGDKRVLERLCADLRDGKYKFMTILGQDFMDEAEDLLKHADTAKPGGGKARAASKGTGKRGKAPAGKGTDSPARGGKKLF